MNILHTISDLTARSGGTTTCTYALLKGLRARGINADILTLAPVNDRLIGDEAFIRTVPGTGHYLSPAFRQALMEGDDYRLFHSNSIWEYTGLITSGIARKKHIPCVITPHGMLYPQALAVSRVKKAVFLRLLLMKDLQRAAAVHATCDEEMRHLRALGVRAPIAVVPNPIALSPVLPAHKAGQKIGYLGRIDPRKKIHRLIDAWAIAQADESGAELVIIGDGDRSYLNRLKSEQARMKLKNVRFTGFLKGEDKIGALDSLSYLVVPSDYENFGMVVAEALSRGVPVIASRGTPWEELNSHGCGWWVDNDADTLARTIREALDTPESLRIEMGRRGQELIRSRYSVETVATMMAQLYEWILRGGMKPDFVHK